MGLYRDSVLMHTLTSDFSCAYMQKAPCAANIPHDDPDFQTTQREQEERLDFMVNYTDSLVRAIVLHEERAASFLLHEVDSSPLIRTAKVSSPCLVPALHDLSKAKLEPSQPQASQS